MKIRILIELLKRNGYSLVRSGKYFIFSNGKISIPVPQHKDINKMLARRILKESGINSEL